MRSLVLAALVGLLVGCSGGVKEGAKELPHPYHVETTVGMVADIVAQVAGEHATVGHIMGTGVDPHLFQPTIDDMEALRSADVVFYAGLLLEGRMQDVFEKIDSSSKPIFAVTAGLPEGYVEHPEAFEGHADPHVWMDLKGWIFAVQEVERSLSELDPAHAEAYAANAASYVKQLEEVDAYVAKVIASIPDASRIMITAHDAFNYFGRAYQIEVLGVQGISTESEAGLGDIHQLVDLIVKRDVKAVFVESSTANKNVGALREGAASRGKEVTLGGTLFSDAMGHEGTYEGTYIGMMDHNATTIARALGGEAPEKGLYGKLTGFGE